MKHKISLRAQHKISIALLIVFFLGCRTNPQQVTIVDSKLDHPAPVVEKPGEMVIQDKAQLGERLRDLQNTVYALEDKVYGMRKMGTLGQYGELKSCQRKLASKQYAGTGEMFWIEPLDRVTDKEPELKLGLNDKKELLALSEDSVRDRVQRFEGYRSILQKRSDDFADKTKLCQAQLDDKTRDAAESSKVLVNEVPKVSAEKAAINQFMCGFVKADASLANFMLNAFARGWLSLSDFDMSQNLVGGTLKDSKGDERSNGFIFNGWKMVFDGGMVTVGELLAQKKDVHLKAWTYNHKAEVEGAAACLAADDGVWNH